MRAVVAGGGVAGSASAIALARIGADVTVYEEYEDPAGPVGSYVSLAVNGLRALAALGCLEPVQQVGFPVARHRMWSGRGRLLGDVPRGRRNGDELISVTLMRADLVTALRQEALRSGARVVTGQRLTGPSDPLAGGAGLIVGADGIWSAARRDLDPAAPEPAYAGLYSVSGCSDGAALPAGMPRDGFNWIFARHGVFLYLPAPDGSVWWTAQVVARQPQAGPAAVTAAGLAELFRGEEQAAALLRAATTVGAAYPGHVLTPVTCRFRGTTVLIGDAAHPVGAGQGASMALEDAVVLARELAAAGAIGAGPATAGPATAGPATAGPHAADAVAAGPVATGLAAFDRQRHERSGKLARTEAANRDAKTAGPVASRMRELIMPHVFSRFYENATGWLYDYDLGSLPAHPVRP